MCAFIYLRRYNSFVLVFVTCGRQFNTVTMFAFIYFFFLIKSRMSPVKMVIGVVSSKDVNRRSSKSDSFIVTQHQSSSQNNLMVFELFIPFFEAGVPTRPKSAKYN